MNRRSFAVTLTAVFAGGAGCLGGSNSRTPAETETATPTNATPTPGAQARIADRSLEPSDDCPTGSPAAIRFAPGDDAVRVSGCAPGSSECSAVGLQSAVYDPEAGELAIGVRTGTVASPDTDCEQAFAEYGYDLTVTFVNRLPDPLVVRVAHNVRDVAAMERVAEARWPQPETGTAGTEA